MYHNYPNLFSPLRIGGLTLKNRIISAPMTYPILTSDGCLTPEAIAFYELRAKGGAAVVTVSEVIVDSKTGKYYDIQVVTDAPNAKDSLAMCARAIKRHGAVASIELSHGGKFALTQGPALGPDDEFSDGVQTVRAMTKADIGALLDAYGNAARLCKAAGFEMLLIHAGHGWLLQQFLSPSTNNRTDEYGGTLENRARLALEVIGRVRESVGPGFPLEVRISAQEYTDNGYSMDDIIEFAKLLDGKADLIQVSTGAHHGSFDKTHPSMFYERGVNVPFAGEIKKHVKTPVAAIGAINEPEMMEDIISAGKADVVEMARALLADPFLPRKARAGRVDEIVRCCRCFTCMAERLTTGLRVCALNPVIGNEYELSFACAPTTPKRVLIAGGGPAGIQAAITAAERGHTVTLCEKSGELGGALKAERGISFKSDLYGFIASKKCRLERSGAKICLNTEVTPELCRKLNPDALIIAVGGVPIVPQIPGIDAENVIFANNLHMERVRLSGKIVVIGGGLVGCETALCLAREDGFSVTVVEQKDELCPEANPRHRPLLLAELVKYVNTLTNTRAVKISRSGLICAAENGGETLVEADTIIVAAGQRPLTDVADALRVCAPEVFEIGDCVKPEQVTQAVFRAHFAALDL